jgi:hypothetical protein
MRGGMFGRFFNVLKVAFLVPVVGRTVVTLDFAFGILNGGEMADGLILDSTNLAMFALLTLAFVFLYVDWRKEPVYGSNPTQEP